MKRTLAILTAIALLIGVGPAALAGTANTANVSAVTGATTLTATTTPPPTTTNTPPTTTTTPPTTTTPTDPTAPTTTTATPTAKPGSLSYVIQRLFERVKVVLTPDRAARAELLAAHAQRRIAELEKLPVSKDGKAFKITLGLVKDYVGLLRRATEDIAAAKAAGKPITAAEQQLLEAAEAGDLFADQIATGSPDAAAELRAESESAVLLATTLGNLNAQKVAELHAGGMSYRQIALSSILADASGTDATTVATKVAEKGFAVTAQEMGYNVKTSHKQHGFAAIIRGMDPAEVKALREQGFSYGMIATLKLASTVTNKTVTELAALIKTNGLDATLQSFGLTFADLRAKLPIKVEKEDDDRDEDKALVGEHEKDDEDDAKDEGKHNGNGLGDKGKHAGDAEDDDEGEHHESAGRGWGGK